MRNKVVKIMAVVFSVTALLVVLVACNNNVANAEWSAWELETEATCISAGTEVRVQASGEVETREIAPTFDEHNYEYVGEMFATCIDDGYKLYKCTDCGLAIKTDIAPAVWGMHNRIADGTCIDCGDHN